MTSSVILNPRSPVFPPFTFIYYAVAVRATEIRHGSSLPMADSLIAATCLTLKAVCISDDPHFAGVRGLSPRWIQET
jgi:predicted nucleic acid-binding protein